MNSETILQTIREKPCSVCFRVGPSDPHHIRTRGAGGSDTFDNLLPLCREHHVETHKIGRATFLEKYKDKILFHRSLHGLPDLEYFQYD